MSIIRYFFCANKSKTLYVINDVHYISLYLVGTGYPRILEDFLYSLCRITIIVVHTVLSSVDSRY